MGERVSSQINEEKNEEILENETEILDLKLKLKMKYVLKIKSEINQEQMKAMKESK